MLKIEAEAMNYWQAACALRAAARAEDLEEFILREGKIAGIAANTAWPKLRELCLRPAGFPAQTAATARA